MNRLLKYSLIIVLLITSCSVVAQEKKEKKKKKERNWTLNGYVSDMQSVMFAHPDSLWMIDNVIHNRLNFNWYISKSFTTSIQIRNRFMYGDQIRFDPTGGGYADGIAKDRGLFDLTENWFVAKNCLLNTSVDRAWLAYEKGKFNIKLGRQRINWGQTFVWNPNDIFNNYSFFDFDYPERPGSDALRIQYYPGMTTTVELAVKADVDKKVTTAALFKFNKWNYDIQFIAGWLSQEDLVIGAGWSGAIKSMSFRGELSYFHPSNSFTDTSGVFQVCLSVDYTFKKQTMIQFEALYCDLTKSQGIEDLMQPGSAPGSVKSMAFTEYNIFGQVTHPVTPLINVTLSAMYYPKLKGFFVGPSVSYSIKDNFDLSFFAQVFSTEFPETISGVEDRLNLFMGFLRLKWSY